MHAADPPDVEVAADSRREEPTLESLFGYLVAIVESGDPDRIQLAWVAAERTLSMRLDGEERTLFAAFFATRAREVRALMAEHAHLRRRFAQLRSTFPPPSADAVRDFVGELRAHNQHEDAVLDGSTEE